MTGSLKILVLEDNPEDAEIVSRVLNKSFAHCEILLAMGKDEYLDALDQFRPDIILSDNSLPQFSASEALSILHERSQHIPFILVTGTATDEFAAGIIKSGAYDYILKDSLTRLPVAIEAAIKQQRLEREKHEAIEQLIESEKKYRTIFLESPLPKFIYDFETLRFLDVNRAAINHYGYTREEFLNMHLLDLRPKQDKEVTLEEIREGQEKLRGQRVNWAHMRKNGERIIVETRAHDIEYNKRKARMVIVNDITERIKAEQDLRKVEQELLNQKIQEQKKVTRAIIKAQEGERNHIGLELHDNVNQLLVSAKMYLNMAVEKKSELKELVKYPIELINASIQEIRSLAYGYVAPLNTIGLEELIRVMLDKIKENSSIQTELEYNAEKLDIEDEMKLNIYRIVQEQINNIVKHSGASNVKISLNDKDNAVNMVIADDGKGFEPNARRRGIGISNMISRVESFNGEINIDSSPGNGCRISLRIPLTS